MKSSPDLRRWSAWRSQAKAKARSTASRSIFSSPLALCSPTTANRSPSSARSSAVRFLVTSLTGAAGAARVVGAQLDVAAAVGRGGDPLRC